MSFFGTALLIFLTALAAIAGCSSGAENRVKEMNDRNHALCLAECPQACVRFLESKCQAPLEACSKVKSDQADLASDMRVECGAGQTGKCDVLESLECDQGDNNACTRAVVRFNRLHASCKAGTQDDCQTIAIGPWPDRVVATVEKSCKSGDQVACRVDETSHSEPAGVIVTVPADYK